MQLNFFSPLTVAFQDAPGFALVGKNSETGKDFVVRDNKKWDYDLTRGKVGIDAVGFTGRLGVLDASGRQVAQVVVKNGKVMGYNGNGEHVVVKRGSELSVEKRVIKPFSFTALGNFWPFTVQFSKPGGQSKTVRLDTTGWTQSTPVWQGYSGKVTVSNDRYGIIATIDIKHFGTAKEKIVAKGGESTDAVVVKGDPAFGQDGIVINHKPPPNGAPQKPPTGAVNPNDPIQRPPTPSLPR